MVFDARSFSSPIVARAAEPDRRRAYSPPMAQKATVCKATVQIADIDRGLYADHQLVLARHPSENDERMMVRLLAFCLCVPADDRDGALEFAKGMWDPDEPELWQKDLTGRIVQWIEVGQPEERRLAKASGRADRVSVFAFGTSVASWSAALGGRIARARNIALWRIPPEQSRELATLAARGMHLQLNRHDGIVSISDETRSVQVVPERLGSE